jgi:hypothetical protein
MDSLMLLGSQLVLSRMCENDRAHSSWMGEVERDIGRAYGLAARLAATFVMLGLLLTASHTTPPAAGEPVEIAEAQPSLTPFSAATWSESMGR